MQIFLIIIGLGLAIPSTVIIVFNLLVKWRAGNEYELSLASLAKIYFVALLGWAIFLNEVMG